MADESEEKELEELLDRLVQDEEATGSRETVCDALSAGLARLGQLLWLDGYIIGPDRLSGASSRFGSEGMVGLAAVAQIGGQLATGAVQLLKAANNYGALALIRQLVEVEYLAAAFAAEHEIAKDWLRADREQRRSFWTPARLRERAEGRFLNTDYWDHCERGGHPTPRGMDLLPGHHGVAPAFLWVDLAGHLSGIWRDTVQAATRIGGEIPSSWDIARVEAAIEAWHEADGLYAALPRLGSVLRDKSR
jgi:hypothetical protein